MLRGAASVSAAALAGPLIGACAKVSRPPLGAHPVLDAHAHLVSPELAAAIPRTEGEPTRRAAGADDLVGELTAVSARRALAVAGAYLWAADFPIPEDPYRDDPEEAARVATENDFALAQAARYPHRLIPFCSVNPKRAGALDELRRCVEQGGARGLKLHLWNSDVSLRQARDRLALESLIEYAASREVPILMHLYNGEVEGFGARDVAILTDDLVAPNRGLRLCLAHAGGAGGYDETVAEVIDALLERRAAGALQAERTWLDLSALFLSDASVGPSLLDAPGGRERLARQLRAWGADHLLWGSDGESGYLAVTRDRWPLDETAWNVVAAQSGAGFLS